MQVYKFGGASVKDADGVRNVAEILKREAVSDLVLVVSAMGKMTNRLEELVHAYYDRAGNVNEILDDIKQYHFDVLHALFPDTKSRIYDEVENVFVELLWALEEEPAFEFNQHYDQIVSQGEILSSRILSAYLSEKNISNKWVDARDVIQTDNTYREGRVDMELSEERARDVIQPLLKMHRIVLTQGFIGGTSENYTTTLGREGSDYTAALLAYFLNAEKVVIWKDVPGVLNADPKFFSNTKKMAELSYHDAIELTYFGASVIHPKTIKPLQNKNIPLYVRSFVDPAESGTVIGGSEARNSSTSYIFKDKQILLSIMPKDFSFIAEDHLSDIFRCFARHNVHVHLMQNSALSFSVCTDNDPQKIEPLIKELGDTFKILYNDNVQLMTIRNYNQEIINKLSENKLVLLEQRSRSTHQMVIK